MSGIEIERRLPEDFFAAALRDDVLKGLTAEPKWLPPKWFYDARGSELFEEITRLPEYYPTRAEREILTDRAAEIASVTRAETLAELGSGSSTKTTLLLDALNIWATNVIVFALWFWSIDHGGPATRGLVETEKCDFLYPQMTIGEPREPCTWSPGFIDYLYLSFTNATAFSPTDTLPLSGRAKLLMMTESAISLLTIALVAARAVNILA